MSSEPGKGASMDAVPASTSKTQQARFDEARTENNKNEWVECFVGSLWVVCIFSKRPRQHNAGLTLLHSVLSVISAYSSFASLLPSQPGLGSGREYPHFSFFDAKTTKNPRTQERVSTRGIRGANKQRTGTDGLLYSLQFIIAIDAPVPT
jgi:hypothetical protein